MTAITRILLISIAALGGLTQVVAGAPITIGASPSKFDIEIGRRPVDDALRVFNFGSEPAEIRVSVHPWTLDEQSEVQLVPPTEQSLDQWMIISPISFEIPPGSFQTVRFSIRPKVEPAEGEHRAMIYLLQKPSEQPADETEGQSVQVVGRLGVAVYGYVGKIERRGRLNDVKVESQGDAAVASFDISSIGTAHVRLNGYYTVWPADRYPGEDGTVDGDPDENRETALTLPEGAVAVGWLPKSPVLPASRRSIPLRFAPELPAGDYVLDVRGDLGGESVGMGLPFTVSDETGEQVVSN